MRESSRWFALYIKKTHWCNSINCWFLDVTGSSRKRTRPRKTWIAIVRDDLKVFNLTNKIALNWIKHKSKVYVANSSYLKLRLDDDVDNACFSKLTYMFPKVPKYP